MLTSRHITVGMASGSQVAWIWPRARHTDERVSFLLALAFAFIVLAVGGGTNAQGGYPRAALGVYLNWIEPQYGTLLVNGQGMVVMGATLDIEIGLVNPFPGATAAAELNWLDSVAVTLSRGDRFEPSREIVARIDCDASQPTGRTRSVVANESVVLLSSNESQTYFQCELDPSEAGLTAGIYTLEAKWRLNDRGNREIKTMPHSLEPSTTQIEVRGVASLDDALDRDLQRAAIAIKRGKLADAEALLSVVLQADPGGTFGLMLRGRARQEAGRCRDAQRDWLQLAAALEDAAPSKSRRQRLITAENRRRAATEWRERARGLECR
jgi:hypothetical protein